VIPEKTSNRPQWHRYSAWDYPGLVETPNAFAKGVIMPKAYLPCSSEFRRQMVD